MEHDRICDCQFRARCSTFNDSWIEARRKGAEGLGCQNQSDEYRAHHCKAFQCSYLTMVVADGFRHLAAEQPAEVKVRPIC